MKLFTLVFLLICYQNIQATPSNVEIDVSFEGSDRNTISYELPVNNCMLTRTSNINNNLSIGGRLMSVSFNIDSPTAIRLWLNGEKCIYLVVKPKDKIQIKAIRNYLSRYPQYNLEFTGSAAVAHSIFNTEYIPIGYKFFVFEDFASNAKDYVTYFKTVKNHIDSISVIWKQLGERDQYAIQNYSLYEKDIRSSLYREAIIKLTKVPIKNDYQSYTDWLNIRQLMFQYGGINDPSLMKTHFGNILIHLYNSDLARKDPSITDTVTQKSDYNYWYYYPKSCIESVWANEIMNDYTSRFPVFDSMQSYKEFKRWFPNSAYQDAFNKLKDSSQNILKNLDDKVTVTAELINNFDSLFSGLKHKKSLVCFWSADDALSLYEIRKLRYLQRSLDSLPINLVFISKDGDAKWRDAIKSRKYSGTHFRISENVDTYLLTSIGLNSNEQVLSTPDFFLYDAEAEKLETRIPFPNSERYFVEFIADWVYKKNI